MKNTLNYFNKKAILHLDKSAHKCGEGYVIFLPQGLQLLPEIFLTDAILESKKPRMLLISGQAIFSPNLDPETRYEKENSQETTTQMLNLRVYILVCYLMGQRLTFH